VADDTKGLPNVDLNAVLDDLKTQDQDKDQTQQPKTDTGNLAQFKTPDDVLKAYKEIQGFSTKVSQENKQLKAATEQLQAELAKLKEERELAGYKQMTPSQQKSFDDAWMEDPEQAINLRVAEQVNMARIQDVLEQEDEKDHVSFQERYAYVNMLSQNPQYQHLASTPRGVRKLFEIGDKLRAESLKKSTGKALESLFGEPLDEEEIAAFRALVKGKGKKKSTTNNSNAYMPDIDTSTSAGDMEPNKDQIRQKRVADAVSKGDVDGAVGALFEDILAE